jgi:outer membrane protein OmpA-like peptidoglycan-associated protein
MNTYLTQISYSFTPIFLVLFVSCSSPKTIEPVVKPVIEEKKLPPLVEPITLTDEMQKEKDEKQAEFLWRSSLTQNMAVTISKFKNDAASIKAIEDSLKDGKPTYYNYLLVEKLASFEITKKNYEAATKIWLRYKKLFPKKASGIDTIIASLKENDGKITFQNVGKEVNLGSTYMPVPELSGKKMFFTGMDLYAKKTGEDIYETVFKDKKWTSVQPILQLNTKNHESALGVSPDGTTLYVFGNYAGSFGGGDIFYSQLTDGGWSKATPFEYPINSANFESDAFLTSDGKAIIFVSDRESGLFAFHAKNKYYAGNFWGNTDIYISFKNEEGNFSPPINIGPMLNTPGAERTPYLHPDGQTLYFSSNGYSGFGDLDLYKSVRLDDTWQNWSKPEHLGRSLNSPGADWGFKLTASSDRGFTAADSGQNNYQNHIFEILPLPKKAKPNNIVIAIRGRIVDENNQALQADLEWQVMGADKNLGKLSSKPVTGEFFITLPAGKEYAYFARKQGYLNQSQSINLTKEKVYKEIEMEIVLVSTESAKTRGTEITLNNIIFESDKDVLDAKSFAELDRLVEILNSDSSVEIEIQGHTSVGRTEDFNLDLSTRRAESVAKYLFEKNIEPTRISTKGYGSSKPRVPNTTEENKSKNRRVSFVIRSR